MELIELFETVNLDLNNIKMEREHGGFLGETFNEFDVTPEEFLKFAKKDIQNDGKQG